jgi:hypothetical protein
MTANELNIHSEQGYMLIIIMSTLVIAPCFGIGSSIFGHKILNKHGKENHSLREVRSCHHRFCTASLLLLASVSGAFLRPWTIECGLPSWNRGGQTGFQENLPEDTGKASSS